MGKQREVFIDDSQNYDFVVQKRQEIAMRFPCTHYALQFLSSDAQRLFDELINEGGFEYCVDQLNSSIREGVVPKSVAVSEFVGDLVEQLSYNRAKGELNQNEFLLTPEETRLLFTHEMLCGEVVCEEKRIPDGLIIATDGNYTRITGVTEYSAERFLGSYHKRHQVAFFNNAQIMEMFFEKRSENWKIMLGALIHERHPQFPLKIIFDKSIYRVVYVLMNDARPLGVVTESVVKLPIDGIELHNVVKSVVEDLKKKPS